VNDCATGWLEEMTSELLPAATYSLSSTEAARDSDSGTSRAASASVAVLNSVCMSSPGKSLGEQG
jgi:hypothetical protein